MSSIDRPTENAKLLTIDDLTDAITGTAAAFRAVTTLQPAGGRGDKVMPPTYEDAAYAFEKRRLPESAEPVDCVLLDSVQSQANRMELALLDAWERSSGDAKFPLPVITVQFPPDARDLRITSLEAPHRIADALLRDSELDVNGKPTAFRKSLAGKSLDASSQKNATPLFQYCPTALVFGLWDSTGPAGGLGAKFPRAIVSEIVGIGAVGGVKTSSRIDPAQIEKNAGPLFRRADDSGWTLDRGKAKLEGDKPVLYKKRKGKDVPWDPSSESFPDEGRPSTANHGNVLPTIDLRRDGRRQAITELEPAMLLRDGSPMMVYTDRKRPIPVGGVTVNEARQTTVLSLPALRRLRFPVSGKVGANLDNVENAARVALAALALCAATLAREQGCDLRSRCLLVPAAPWCWELLDSPAEEPRRFKIDSPTAKSILAQAVAAAEEAGLPWMGEELRLRPSDELLTLVKRSQNIRASATADAAVDEE